MQPLIMETAAAVINKQKNFSIIETMMNTNSLEELIFAFQYLKELKIVPDKDKLNFSARIHDDLLNMPDELIEKIKPTWNKRKLEELVQIQAYDNLSDEEKDNFKNLAVSNILKEDNNEDEEISDDDFELTNLFELNSYQLFLQYILASTFGEENIKILKFEDLKEYDFVITKPNIIFSYKDLEVISFALRLVDFKAFTILTDYAKDDPTGEKAIGVRIAIAVRF